MADVYKQSFKQNYTNNIELSIFNCGIERCAPGQTWGPGIRDHYLIHLVLSGKGVFEVGGRTWEVSPGDLFFARPSQLIRYTADEQQPWGVSAIKEFALPLIVGILAGAYTSIFIASTFWASWKESDMKAKAAAAQERKAAKKNK